MDEPPDTTGVQIHDEGSVPVSSDGLRSTAELALRELGVPAGANLTLTLVTPERIAELKEVALGVRAPTDVLSFPMDDPGDPSPGPLVLGDIVICPVVARAQARALGRALEDELATLAVHGILHILGRDHAEPDAELAMAREERALLATIGGAR